MARELIVKPLGLVTRPNIYGQYPVGGMLTAANLVMRAPGIIESAPALVSGASFGASNDVVHDLFPLDGGHMSSISRTGGGVWAPRVDSTASTFSTPISSPTFSQLGRISLSRSRERVIFNTQDKGCLVMDTANPTPPAALRMAGLTQPSVVVNAAGTTNPVALPANSCAGYAFCVRRVFSDGYEIISKPSLIFIIFSGAVIINPKFGVPCAAGTGYIVGDYVELYRTNIVSGATASTDPGTSLKMIASKQLNTTDITVNFQVLFEDVTQPGPLGVTDGQDLYTNPGQRGLLGGHRQPDIAQSTAVFKNYVFLGDITERPQLIFQIPGGLFDTQNAGFNTAAFRTNGIGTRQVTGTVTIGSANITAVSATDMLGIVPGQQFSTGFGGAVFPFQTRVLSAGGTTITMDANATGSGTGITLIDRIEIMGTAYVIDGGGDAGLAKRLSQQSAVPPLEITTSENLLILQVPATGLLCPRWIIEPVRPNTGTSFTVRATNGQNYQPPLTEIGLTATTIPYKRTRNLLKWSNDSQPEHFPAPNETEIGTASIIALEATRDALWIFCTDGLFRLSGAGGQWRVDTADTTLVLASPRASCVLKEAIYAYTNQGLVRVTDAGTENLSEQIIGDLLPGSEYIESANIIVESHEAEDEVVIRVSASEVYVYSVREQTFTTVNHLDVTAMCYARYPVSGLPALAVGQSPSGSAPSYSLWNSTSSYLAPTARFHPLFAQDPLASKQWIDGTYIFDLASAAKSLTPAWNNTTSPASPLKNTGQFFNESRANFGVPRRAAIGHTLAPGFSFGALSTSTKFYALSMRFRQLSEQNLHR